MTRSNILLLDGGLGTSLEKEHNVVFSRTTPLWSSHLLVSDPDTLLACQKDFGAVPVDIILSATYQVSIKAFRETRTAQYPEGVPEREIPRFLDDAVSIAEKAKHPGARVALSLGPYGACMIPSQEYTGIYDQEHDAADGLYAWHDGRMNLFAKAIPHMTSRIGFVALETIPRVDEICAVRRAVSSNPQLNAIPFWISCLFPGDGRALPDGTSAEDAVRAMLDPEVAPAVPWGIGINCTKTWKLDGLLRRYEHAVGGLVNDGRISAWPALVLYPDGTNGEVYNTETGAWDAPSGVELDRREPWGMQVSNTVKRVAELGKWSQVVVGGCCMASPNDIQRLRLELARDKGRGQA